MWYLPLHYHPTVSHQSYSTTHISAAAPIQGHRPEANFKCSNCNRVYLRQSCLKRHMRVECGKAPKYQCQFSEDLSLASSLKWAAAWQKLAENVPSIMWRSGITLGKGLDTSVISANEGFSCSACGRVYKLKSSLRNHQKWECGKEPQFQCPHCVYRAKQKMHISRHMERMHKEKLYKQELM
ncbi:zinc finger protein 836-like [Phymastichus coffea]|uniref:zinc finger protein 836-like n=1 Tax=Phymastichus coffea TaxID=108790 RepID=UPI00273A7535|nr:zinc finger protein 836-like [Phymastichus coffea]